MRAGEWLGAWCDGELLGAAPVDPGLMSGIGVFETLIVTEGQPFALSRHLKRMCHGAHRMGIPPVARADVEEALADLAPALAMATLGRLRLTLTPGPQGSGRLLVTFARYQAPNNVAVHISPYRRNETSPVTGIKCTSYAENLLALRNAQEAGFDEAIVANTRGELCEGTRSNIFVEIDGEVLTPSLTSGCLPGITRELCIEWARGAGVPIRQTAVPVSVMNSTMHAAVTSALMGIVPITRVGKRTLRAGPLLRELAGIYFHRRGQEIDP